MMQHDKCVFTLGCFADLIACLLAQQRSLARSSLPAPTEWLSGLSAAGMDMPEELQWQIHYLTKKTSVKKMKTYIGQELIK